MGKCYLHASSFIFYPIIIKVAGNQERHRSSDEFDFGPDQTTNFGVTCPWMTKLLHFRTWISLDQNSGVHGNRKPPLTYNRENGVSSYSRLLLIRSFLYLQVTRTCIKSGTSWTFGQIGPLTTELAALERLKNSHRFIIGKWCLHHISFTFDRIIIKVAGNQDRHKSSVEFDFGPNQTTHFGVTCP